MDVCFVCSKYWPIVGGVETYNRQVAQALQQAGHSVRVATRRIDESEAQNMRSLLTGSGEPRTYKDQQVTVHLLGGSPWRTVLLRPSYRLHHYQLTEDLAIHLTYLALRKSLEAAIGDADVVHYSGTGRELLGFAALRHAKKIGARFVVTAHMHPRAWGDSGLDFRLYRQADHYIALTEAERKYVHDHGIPDENISTVGHGVTVDGTGRGTNIRRALGIAGPIVLYLGRKALYKGYALVLEAAPLVWDSHPDVHFIVAGPDDKGHTEKLRQAHQETLNDPRLHEKGFVSDEEKENLYDACTIYCQPSRAEAYGLVYQEAWAYGKPVIARRIPTMEELIGSTGGGLLVDGSGESVAHALLRLLGSPEHRSKLGKAGREKAASQTWAGVAEQLVSVYQSC